jgi:dihydropyrimidinase
MGRLLIKNGTCVNAEGSFQADILIDGGRIAAIGLDLDSDAYRILDATDRLIVPGGVDVHVHLPWPSGDLISTDNFESGTQAAAFGGVTTVIDFVIPDEEETLESAVQRKLNVAERQAWVDFGLHINIRGNVEVKLSEVPDLVGRGFPSFKVYMAYEGFRLGDSDLLRVMETITQAGGIMGVHAENGLLADYFTHKLITSGETALANYPQARCSLCEVEAIHRVLTYARLLGTRLHIHHVSTAQGAEMIGAARREGLPVTGETCPHYLVFSDEEYRGDPIRATHLVCAPSIKTAHDRVELWKALANDSLSIVATDHCPYTREQKEAHTNDFSQVPGGMAGVEVRLPIIYTEGFVANRLSLSRLVKIWSAEPARVFGLYPRKGAIAVGSDADLVILDPAREDVLSASRMHMNTDCLPYDGRRVYGIPDTTILRGQILVENGELVAQKPQGDLIRRFLH